jgi:PAS domain S-box-containing protein
VPPSDVRSIAIVEQAPLPACVLDPNGWVVAANRRLEELLGCGSGGLRGRSLGSLAYPPDAELARGALAAVFGQRLDRHLVDTRCQRLDNQQLVWGAWDLSPVHDGRGRPQLALAVVRDLTEAMRSEHERRFFEFLLKIMGEAADSDAMLTAAVQTICHFTRCAMGQAWVPVDGALVCSTGWYAKGYGFDQLRADSEQLRFGYGAGLPGRVWTTGQPCLLRDADDLDRFDRGAAARRSGVGEAIAVPVKTPTGLVAVLEFFVAYERVGEPGRLQRIARAAGELGPIIERRRAEDALRASEERFRGVTGAAMDAIVSADAEGRLRSWNQGAEQMFGWAADEVLGRPLTVIIPERLRALHEEGLARVRQSGHSKLAGSVVELVALHRDGHEFPVELSIGAWRSSEGLAFSGVIRDITERRRAEDALRASEERFRGVTGAAMDAIVSADAEGRLRSWNQGAEQMFGWAADEVLGRPLTVIIPERLRALHEEGLARVRQSGHSKLAGSVVELVALHRDGHEFPVELSIGAWRSSEGLAFSGVIRDITERRRAEDALAAASRELERTNAELETLMYSASHDLKSPMVSLLGYLEYLRVDYGDVLGEEGNHYVQRMSDCTLYMQRLIHDLIDLSRVGRLGGDVGEVDLAELAGTIVDEAVVAHPAARFHVGRLPVVASNPVSFRQLLTNLVENAVRHGGRPDVNVTIEAATRADGALELSVRDDGKGIPPEHRERVFGVFERLDGPSTSAGTGMGLAICRKIVELLGGSIAIHGSAGSTAIHDSGVDGSGSSAGGGNSGVGGSGSAGVGSSAGAGGGSAGGGSSAGGGNGGADVRVVLPGHLVGRWPEQDRNLALHDRGALV